MMRICERVILANGGKKENINGKVYYSIVLQTPIILETLP